MIAPLLVTAAAAMVLVLMISGSLAPSGADAGSALPPPGQRHDPDSPLRLRLARAGLYGTTAPQQLLGTQLVAVAVLCLAGWASADAFLLDPTSSTFVLTVSAALGWSLPPLALSLRSADRARKIDSAVPRLADLLVLCLEGGFGLDAAVQRAAVELRGPAPDLALELELTLEHWTRGDDRARELQGLRLRTGSDSLADLLMTLDEARTEGTTVTTTLATQADTLRSHAAAVAGERARKLPMKVLAMLASFVFPAAFVVMLGPSILQALKALAEAGG